MPTFHIKSYWHSKFQIFSYPFVKCEILCSLVYFGSEASRVRIKEASQMVNVWLIVLKNPLSAKKERKKKSKVKVRRPLSLFNFTHLWFRFRAGTCFHVEYAPLRHLKG